MLPTVVSLARLLRDATLAILFLLAAVAFGAFAAGAASSLNDKPSQEPAAVNEMINAQLAFQ